MVDNLFGIAFYSVIILLLYGILVVLMPKHDPPCPFLPPGWRMEGNSAVSQLAVAKVQTPVEAKALRGCHFG